MSVRNSTGATLIALALLLGAAPAAMALPLSATAVVTVADEDENVVPADNEEIEGESPAALRDAALNEADGFAVASVQSEFIKSAVPGAKANQKATKVPASVAIGQAALESNWGRSKLAKNDRNYFGFKCSKGKPGPIATGCHKYTTKECTPKCHTTTAYFRVYKSFADSLRDYGRLLSTSKVYQPAFKYTGDPDRFIKEVGKHYATDPQYAAKVISVMKKHNLYQYNK
ncbi:glucosaminidase [Pseudonocardiaceae bacterium YIM PH 21723]|nr:glucosaminidase [Pseudonocardiaceae bacterium YIM PH 21723]